MRSTITAAVLAAALLSITAPARAGDDFEDFSWAHAWSGQAPATTVSIAPQEAGPHRLVRLQSRYAPGTIVVSTIERRLYLITGLDEAISYDVGVGRPGFEWTGVHAITRKQEWPSWTPPAEMLKRRPDLPRHMAGGIENPLGARAMYLGGTMYRIHGSNEPDSIGQAVSSGCLRMRNEDVVDLYDRVKVGTKVIVL